VLLVIQSRSVTTMLRSTPWGRGGLVRQLALGDAVGPVREVLNDTAEPGELPSIICRPGRPARGGSTLRGRTCRASRGNVRVESCPSWWQPMQPLFFIASSQFSSA
jgi:hypothetical protein